MKAIPLPLSCMLIGLCGLVLSTLLILKSLNKKAKTANIIFKPSSYFKDDWYTPVCSIVSLVMAYIFLPYAPTAWGPLKILGIFGTIGYIGSDIPSRVFSVAANKLYDAIGYKAKQTDEANGTTDAPTPAVKSTAPKNP